MKAKDKHFRTTKEYSKTLFNNKLNCQYCRTTFVSSKFLMPHLARYHFVTIICKLCRQAFANKALLERHLDRQHKCVNHKMKSEQIDQKDERIIQDYSKTEESEIEHYGQHEVGCNECDEFLKILDEEDLESKESFIKCYVCNKLFNSNSDLEKHCKVHIKLEQNI
ncbi:hypothetical protein ACFFRR_011536 [Megaselia abdita]